jgi:3-dehydroquinate synthetase
VLDNTNLPTRIPAELPAADLYQAMGSDKKKAAGRLRFVLIRDVGDVFLTADVPRAGVLDSLIACGAGVK